MSNRAHFEDHLWLVKPATLDRLEAKHAAWYETRDEIRAGLRWGKRKEELMRWVRREMGQRLTRRERRCVELYYFQNLTYEEVGIVTGTNPSSVFRAVRRSVRKLRARARAQGITLPKRAKRQGIYARRR